MLRLVTRNASASRSGLAAHTRHTSPRATSTNATCPAGWWAFHTMRKVAPPIDSLYKHASNISAATKLRAISARRRFFWLSSLRCMPCITVQEV